MALVPLFLTLESLPQEGAHYQGAAHSRNHGMKVGTAAWRGARAFLAFWIFGVVLNAIAFFWTTSPSILFGGIAPTPAYLLFALYCLASATFFPLIFSPYIFNVMHCTRKSKKPVSLVCMALVATAAERFVPRFFFWTFGSLTHDSSPLNQWSSFFGFSTISFFIFFGASAIARALHQNMKMPEKALGPIGFVFAMWLSVWGIGWLRIVSLEADLASARTSKIAWVQPNFTFNELSSSKEKTPEKQLHNLDNLLGISNEAVEFGKNNVFGGETPELLIWPESVAPSDFGWNPAMLARAQEFAKLNELSILAQAVQFNDKEVAEKGWNRSTTYSVSYLIRKDGSQSGKFLKWIPIPFGESVPFEDTFPRLGDWVRNNIGNTSKVGRGTSYEGLAFSPDFRVAPLICFDAIYQKLPRLQASEGNASLFVNQANFVWMGRSNAGYEFLELARFRAIENGRSMILAANTGPSVAIDPLGRLLTQPTPLMERAFQAAKVPMVTWTTLYSILGDIPLALMGALGGVRILWQLSSRARA